MNSSTAKHNKVHCTASTPFITISNDPNVNANDEKDSGIATFNHFISPFYSNYAIASDPAAVNSLQ